MSSLQIDTLSKRYGAQTILHALSLDVADGELVALLGPSGSGKSTLLKIIAGIEQPDSGDVRLNGASILNLAAHRRGAVLMFQQAYLFPFLNVRDNIGFGLKMRGLDRQQIDSEVARMLELVELPGTARHMPGQLSGGMQQRVALARALVTEPRVLLLDEPLSNLDATIRATLRSAIRRVQQQLGITTVLVTHDLDEAIGMADRVAILHDHRIDTIAAPAALFERPPTRVAAQAVGVRTFVQGVAHGNMLETAHGVLELPAPARWEETTWAIRPEHLRVASAAGRNVVAATIRDIAYRGEYAECLAVYDGLTLPVRVLNGTAYRHGETLLVELPRDRLFAVRES